MCLFGWCFLEIVYCDVLGYVVDVVGVYYQQQVVVLQYVRQYVCQFCCLVDYDWFVVVVCMDCMGQ